MGADLYVPCSHGTSQLVAFVGEVVESTTFPLAQHIPAELSSPLPQSFGMLAALQAVRGLAFPVREGWHSSRINPLPKTKKNDNSPHLGECLLAFARATL